MKKQKWIWEYEEYPNFKYDKDRLSLILRDIAYEQGKLKAFMLLMDQESTKYSLATTLENEIIASCQIEGEILNRQSVRSSIKQKLGLESHEYYNAIRGHNRKRKLLYGRSHLSSKSSKILNVKNPRFLHSI